MSSCSLTSLASSSKSAINSQDVNFMKEFFAHSRLHHIARMGTMFKEYVQKLRNDAQHEFPGLSTLTDLAKSKDAWEGPKFMHIDIDCFFVSVGLRKHPELRGSFVLL